MHVCAKPGNQVGVGKAVKKLIAGGMKRSDIFVTTKTLPCKLCA